ncbi:aldehyde dehydrogenase family protein [Desulfoluna spongiiphila]|uniref:Aldehyde dehydrogenase n=1 Tax=Desulfoluna spongiiphila TaxID=419481 RepID=A0A1G5CUN9_9BACT|nr:aldehyde dehydrogenase family protein [Desulfoluna spongiiphila]SCY05971.1 succinate-semialdehyde dehydrogenase / glutarate-semialdehyde dehydrogenase [Desulfoluna spongiiphila]
MSGSMEAQVLPDNEATPCCNAVTGELLGHSPLHTTEELKEAIAAGRQAQATWAALPVKERVRRMMPVREYMMANLDELAETVARDVGKTRIDALVSEIVPAMMALTYYCGKAKGFLKPRGMMPGNIFFANKWSKIHRVPFGVIGIISPWNYPFSIPFSEVVMGLLAGNAVVLKTASETQAVGLALKECLEAADLPKGLFSFINMPGRVAGDAFLESGVDKLFFTGSVPVGKILMAKAAETLTPVSLELGGNDAMLVCEDADLHRAVNGAVWAGLQNAGQSCGGVERIYVHAAVYEPFMKILKTKVEKLRVGYDRNHTTDVGAIATSRQLETVKRHVDDALAKGAVIYAQSKSPKDPMEGHFYPPTVLIEVTHDMLVMAEETFGPVLGVMKVASMDDAIILANDSDLGLTGSVWTKKGKKGAALARRIMAGAVTVNDHLMSHGLAETPWGGFKESGIGRSHGAIGFAEMTESQVVVRDVLPFVKKNLWWHPFSPRVYATIKGVAQALYAPTWKGRAKGLGKVLMGFPRMFMK